MELGDTGDGKEGGQMSEVRMLTLTSDVQLDEWREREAGGEGKRAGANKVLASLS